MDLENEKLDDLAGLSSQIDVLHRIALNVNANERSVLDVRANAYFGCILTKDDFAPELITPASLF